MCRARLNFEKMKNFRSHSSSSGDRSRDHDGLLITLQRELLQYILQYLKFHDLGRLDQAIVSHGLRPGYLHALDRMICLDAYWSSRRRVDEKIQWIISRNVFLSELQTDSLNDKSLIKVFHHCQSHLRTLSVFENIPDSLLTFRYPSLTHFDTWTHLPEPQLCQFLQLNPQLETIDLVSDGQPYTIALCHSLAQCQHLQHLDLFQNYWFDDACVEALLSGNLDILTLNLRETTIGRNSIEKIFNSYPHLRSFSADALWSSRNLLDQCFRQVIGPALADQRPEVQVSGIKWLAETPCHLVPIFFTLLTLCRSKVSFLNLLDRIISFHCHYLYCLL